MAKRKKDNEDPENKNIGQPDDSADNFGLPDIEYKPLDRTEPEPEVRETFIEPEPAQPVSNTFAEEHTDESNTVYEEEEGRSKAPAIIIGIIVVVIAAAGFLIWKYWAVPKQLERERLEVLARQNAEAAKRAEDERLAKEAADAEKKRLADEAAKAVPAVGTIETLSGKTSRYYVVLSSDIDDDLITDYAKRLSEKGVSTKIVPPYGTSKFFRLTMASDFGSYAEAQAGADAAKGEYGNTLWVIYY